MCIIFGCNNTEKKSYISEIYVDANEQKIDRNYTEAIINKKIKSKIKRRGGYSYKYPKFSYELDFENNMSLFNLPKDDDWILNANYIDKTFLRHVISYELFSEMNQNNVSPSTKYLELFFNNKYKGLYVLMQKLDKSTLMINSKDTSSFIFKEPHIFRKNYDTIISSKPQNPDQQTFPEFEVSSKSFVSQQLRGLFLQDEPLSHSEFNLIFDLNNVLDWHLLLLITNNQDGILKNFFMYKADEKTPIRFSPWDYDHSFGRDGDNELNMDERPINLSRSIMFKKLNECGWYKIKLKEKWEYYNQINLLSKDGLRNQILEKSDSIRHAVMKNVAIWPNDSRFFYDQNNFDQEIEIMLEYINRRHKRLSNLFNK
tara:strand:+ start:256 stop:1368 length:1113 start_codon:yes stop_codon:yes gene_type:complete